MFLYSDDVLNVHDGATLLDPEIGGLAFSSFLRVLPLPIESTGSDMYLNFISNDVNLGTPLGFNLSFTARKFDIYDQCW